MPLEELANSTTHPNPKFWKSHIKTWEQSNLTRAEYCRQQKLSYWSFDHWRRKKPGKKRKATVSFAPVPVNIAKPAGQPISSATLKIEAGIFKVEIPEGFSVATLTQVLNILESRQ